MSNNKEPQRATKLLTRFVTQQISLLEFKLGVMALSLQDDWDTKTEQEEIRLLLVLSMFFLGYEVHIESGLYMNDVVMAQSITTVFGKLINIPLNKMN